MSRDRVVGDLPKPHICNHRHQFICLFTI